MNVNSYELAHRAMRLQASIECGPGDRFCDGGAPASTCPAHGGDYRDEEIWTAEDDAAFHEWRRRWASEVMS